MADTIEDIALQAEQFHLIDSNQYYRVSEQHSEQWLAGIYTDDNGMAGLCASTKKLTF